MTSGITKLYLTRQEDLTRPEMDDLKLRLHRMETQELAALILAGYALLAGRPAGQYLYGGNAANDDLTLEGTSHATKTSSYVLLQPTSGNVGIGTATPGSKLSIAGGNVNLDDDYNLSWGDASTLIRGNSATDYILFRTAGADVMRIISGGNVGIGTATPAADLHTYSSNVTGLRVERHTTAAGYTQLGRTTGAFTGSGVGSYLESSSGQLQLRAASGSDVWLGNGTTGNVVILGSTGAVGIGITSPLAPLNTFKAGIVSGEAPASSGTTPVNPMARFSGSRGTSLDIGGQYSSPWGTWLQVADTGALGTYYPLLLQPNGGLVGIGGVAAPTAALDINSDILRLRTAKTPASAGAAGNAGDICWDATHIYVCVATNTWKGVLISSI